MTTSAQVSDPAAPAAEYVVEPAAQAAASHNARTAVHQARNVAIVADIRAGLFYAEIARKHGIAKGSIWRIAKRNGVQLGEQVRRERAGRRRQPVGVMQRIRQDPALTGLGAWELSVALTAEAVEEARGLGAGLEELRRIRDETWGRLVKFLRRELGPLREHRLGHRRRPAARWRDEQGRFETP